eukprot:jgi/Chrpa1/8338/Chrysochromulina_OHIO_Genome00001903-RA
MAPKRAKALEAALSTVEAAGTSVEVTASGSSPPVPVDEDPVPVDEDPVPVDEDPVPVDEDPVPVDEDPLHGEVGGGGGDGSSPSSAPLPPPSAPSKNSGGLLRVGCSSVRASRMVTFSNRSPTISPVICAAIDSRISLVERRSALGMRRLDVVAKSDRSPRRSAPSRVLGRSPRRPGPPGTVSEYRLLVASGAVVGRSFGPAIGMAIGRAIGTAPAEPGAAVPGAEESVRGAGWLHQPPRNAAAVAVAAPVR